MAKSLTGKKLPKGIRQRSKSSYEGRVTVNGVSFSVHASTVTECRDRMDALRLKIKGGSLCETVKIRYSAWFERWLDSKKHEVKPSTVDTYITSYNGSIKGTTFDGMYISEIMPSHVETLLYSLKDAGKAHKTISMVKTVLVNSFKYAERDLLISRNPAQLARLPKQDEPKERPVLTREQTKWLLEWTRDNSYLHNVFVVLLNSGIRIGELRGLKRPDIDFRNNEIHVRRTVNYLRSEKRYVENTPKTRTSRRDIPLTADAKEALKDELSKMEMTSLSDYIFKCDKSDVLTKDAFEWELDRFFKEMKEQGKEFPHITAHCLRHTFATRCMEAGMQPNTLKAILGHSSIKITLDLYAHVLPDTKQKEMKLLEDVI